VPDLVFNNFTTDRKYGAEFFKKIIQEGLDELGFKGKNIELSVNLVGEGRIKALNKKYRGKNRTTDVLSFPLKEKVSTKTVTGGIIPLGDVFICLPVARKEARRQGISLDSELALLTIHGVLHLLGYDHEEISQREKMFKLQDEILKRLATSD